MEHEFTEEEIENAVKEGQEILSGPPMATEDESPLAVENAKMKGVLGVLIGVVIGKNIRRQ